MKYIRVCLLLALFAWFGKDGLAQQKQPVTSIQPDCMIFFNLSTASAGAQAAVGAVGTSGVCDNHQVGAYGWSVAYTSHGFSALSLSFQSAPDNAGGTAPGTWATVAVCGTSECLGINPNTATTSAITTTKAIAPWFRVNLTSKTGTGGVVGVLYGYKYNITTAGGRGGSVTFPVSTFLATDSSGNAITGNSALAPTAVQLGISASAPATSIAIGQRTVVAGASNAISIGDDATVNSNGNVMVGDSGDVAGAGAIGIGNAVQVNGATSIAIGQLASTSAAGAISLGQNISNGFANSIIVGNNGSFFMLADATGITPNTLAFAGLGSPTFGNGTQVYCSDCTVTSSIDNTCLGSGSGAMASRVAGAWTCNP